MLFYKPQKQINIPCLKIENTEIDCVDEFNFLGLYLDKHINWNKHTQIVSSKVSQVIGIMYKLKGYVPQSILQTIYNSLIVPRLNYCLLAWGYNFDRVFLAQKKAIRIVNHSHYNAHTEPIFKQQKLLKLKDLYNHQLLKFYYKLTNNKLPFYFNSMSVVPSGNIHEYNIRSKDKFFVRRVNHSFAKLCIRYELVQYLNKMPKNVIDKVHTHSFRGFCSYTKEYFINSYELLCQIRNCYICNSLT